MLVLSRERDQSLMIGDDIEIRVVDVRGDKVRLGVNAPRSVSVHRSEIYQQIQERGQLRPQPGTATIAVAPAGPPLRIAVLASGAGSTLKNLIDRIAARRLNASIELVVASRPDIGALHHAAHARLAARMIDRKAIGDVKAFSGEVFAALDEARIDLVLLAGWLSLLDVPEKYFGRVMNIHPALLPGFGGHGMFGGRVHQAVLSAGCKVSGCTVHFVDNEYDAGPIILQRCVPVAGNDTPDTLAARVAEQEREAYPEAIELFRAGRLSIVDRRVVIAPAQ